MRRYVERGEGEKTRRVWYKVGYKQREPTSPIQFHANTRKMGAAAKKKKKKKKKRRRLVKSRAVNER